MCFDYFSCFEVCCFDKTGTLTKEGLDFLGVVPVMDQELQEKLEMGDDIIQQYPVNTFSYISAQGEIRQNEFVYLKICFFSICPKWHKNNKISFF